MVSMMKKEGSYIKKLSVSLLIFTNACRPVLTIGWGEILILVILIVILLGPALFGFYRKIDEFRNWKTQKNKEADKD
jgi:hypothetical protein